MTDSSRLTTDGLARAARSNEYKVRSIGAGRSQSFATVVGLSFIARWDGQFARRLVLGGRRFIVNCPLPKIPNAR